MEVLDNPAVRCWTSTVDVDCYGASTGVIEVLMDDPRLDYVVWRCLDTNVAFDLAAGGTRCCRNQGVCADTLQPLSNRPLNLVLIDSTFADCGLDNGKWWSLPMGVGPYAYSWEPAFDASERRSTLECRTQHRHGDGRSGTVEVRPSIWLMRMEVVPYEFISPNGNGANETWVIENGAQHEDLRISVYNRWVRSFTRVLTTTHGVAPPATATSCLGDVLLGGESEMGCLPCSWLLEIQAP